MAGLRNSTAGGFRRLLGPRSPKYIWRQRRRPLAVDGTVPVARGYYKDERRNPNSSLVSVARAATAKRTQRLWLIRRGCQGDGPRKTGFPPRRRGRLPHPETYCRTFLQNQKR